MVVVAYKIQIFQFNKQIVKVHKTQKFTLKVQTITVIYKSQIKIRVD